MKSRKKAVLRFVIGGLCALMLMVIATCLFELLAGGIRGVFHAPALVGHGAEARFGSYGLALLVQSALIFALGGMVGLATLPFAEDGKTLLGRSVLHFLVTAVLFALLMVFCFGLLPGFLPQWLGTLLAVYLAVWAGRYVGWYLELLAMREKLGLKPTPSPLKWRETLPYFFFALLLCDVLPPVLRLLDAPDVPVLTGLLLPFLLLPVGGFFSGLALGRRRGFCPLYPVLCFVCYLPMVFLLFNASALFHCFIVGGAALLGSTAGALLRRRRKKRETSGENSDLEGPGSCNVPKNSV